MTEYLPGVSLSQYDVNQDGMMNDVIIANRKWVFRFAKTESAVEILHKEIQILDLMRPRIGISIPDPIFKNCDCIVYPFLDGKPLLRIKLWNFRLKKHYVEQRRTFVVTASAVVPGKNNG